MPVVRSVGLPFACTCEVDPNRVCEECLQRSETSIEYELRYRNDRVGLKKYLALYDGRRSGWPVKCTVKLLATQGAPAGLTEPLLTFWTTVSRLTGSGGQFSSSGVVHGAVGQSM